MRFKRTLIMNKSNGQVSVTIPSKIMKKLNKAPKNVFIEISDMLSSKEVRTKKIG